MSAGATLPGMDFAIKQLPSADIDELGPLWKQLLAHHSQQAPHLEELAPVRSPESSWRLRRELYLEWLSSPDTAALTARGPHGLLGYAMVRVVVDRPGSWQWGAEPGDRVGVLETLVVHDDARGAGVGQALLDAARRHLDRHGLKIMKISVIAGNEGALRFYRREGAVDFVQTLVMPLTPPS